MISRRLSQELDSAGSGATIVEVKKGAVDDFNQLNPLRTIQPHDMILSIDEAKGKEAIGKKLAQAPLSDAWCLEITWKNNGIQRSTVLVPKKAIALCVLYRYH